MDLNSNIVIGFFFQVVKSELEYSSAMSLHHRIVQLRKDLGISRAELARRSGVPYDNLNKIERGEVDKPRGNTLALIAEALGTSEPSLLYGLDNPEPKQPKAEALQIRGEVAAGHWLEADLFEHERAENSQILGDSRYPPNLQFLVRVRGDSMNKIVQDGELAVCLDWRTNGNDIKSGDVVIIERSRDGGQTIERTLKEVVITEDGVELWPRSTDPRFQEPVTYNDHDEDATEVRIIAKYLWAIRIRE